MVFGSCGSSVGDMVDLDQPFGSPDANLVQTITLEALVKSHKNLRVTIQPGFAFSDVLHTSN